MMSKEAMNKLLALYLEGVATEEEERELLACLQQHPEWQQEARRQMAVHGQLSVLMQDDLSEERFVGGIMQAVEQEDADQFTEEVRQKIQRGQWLRRALAVAAVIAVSLVALVLLQPESATQSGEATMASVVRADGVEWAGSQIESGAVLGEGGTVKISKGLLEMDLAGQGRLIVEGPAHLEFPEDGKAVLHHGRVVMRATKQGIGYRMETPLGSVVDLGTEFGVSVEEDGVVETHVIDGSVEAFAKGDKGGVKLLKNDAMRFGQDGGEKIQADLGNFYTEMPPSHNGGAGYIHWSFDEGEGITAHSKGKLAKEAPGQGGMTLKVEDEGSLPQWSEGVSSSALSFDGKGAYGESSYRGIGGGKPRSVCFWVKVPKDLKISEGYGLVSWGIHNVEGKAWQIAVNPQPEQGPVGRLRLGLFGGQVVGSTDLRDGQWHHVAVVLYGGTRPDVGTHVLLYLDGKQEKVSRRALQEVLTDVDSPDHGLWVGRNMAYFGNGQGMTGHRFFRGSLDELYIFDYALSAEEVQALMKERQ
ncbi:hypothetical protein Rhal01_03475 [Rubritalea halochordaticola]|uniref:LamG-like jellyroll fold domain-containing protein n=1 Tax=Rubritalea halochordaticola TaxID=714537 RepID=A0ABP9V7D4_9BACT